MNIAIPGIHHITAIASDPQRNIDFYTGVLGQRLVKITVNYDDPGAYHLYYGDHKGTPGTILTFFAWPHAQPGRKGAGEIGATAYAIPEGSIPYWQERLRTNNIVFSELQTRFGQTVLPLKDPDGMVIELVATDPLPAVQPWRQSPVPEEMALHGLLGATLWVNEIGATATLLHDTFGIKLSGQESARYRFRTATAGPSMFIDLLEQPSLEWGQIGVGTVHHIALRAQTDAEQSYWQQTISDLNYRVTPIMDRQYFRSIYFREAGGVLFEIATDHPGFTLDEPVESLGQNLKLPPWLESHRAQIVATLPTLDIFTR